MTDLRLSAIENRGYMKPEDLAETYPLLYHMANEGTWPSIRKYGLLTTRQLVELSRPALGVADAILKRRRPSSVELMLAGQAFQVRDQAPLRLNFLESCLQDMTVQEWLDVLNGRVFFWLTAEKLGQLLAARRYRNRSHDVLVVSTKSLLSEYGDAVRLSPVNSGATLYPNASARGPETFRTIGNYDFTAWRKRRGLGGAIVELAVVDGVPNISNHVVRVERRHQAQVLEVLFQR